MASDLRRQINGLRKVGKSSLRPLDAYERLLESVFLNGVTEFEAFLEEFFFAAVARRIRPGETKPIVSLRDPETARSLVLRPRESYLKWLPYHEAQERADQYLANGSPFNRLTARASVTRRLGQAMAVRNAVAHKGGAAYERFHDATDRKYTSPGEYLAASLGKSTVCDAFLADFVRFGKALCVSDTEALRLLGPEGPFPAGKKLDPGRYECLGCNSIQELQRREPVACSVCDPPCQACGTPTSQAAQFRPA
jgi:hypothetical protein